MTLEVNGAFETNGESTFKMSSQPDALISAETSEADALSKSFISALNNVRIMAINCSAESDRQQDL